MLDPIGSWREEFGWAQVSSVVTNLARSIWKKKGTKPKLTKPSDFIPEWDARAGGKQKKQPKVQSVEEQKSILLSLARAHNKWFKRTKGRDTPPKGKEAKKTDV